MLPSLSLLILPPQNTTNTFNASFPLLPSLTLVSSLHGLCLINWECDVPSPSARGTRLPFPCPLKKIFFPFFLNQSLIFFYSFFLLFPSFEKKNINLLLPSFPQANFFFFPPALRSVIPSWLLLFLWEYLCLLCLFPLIFPFRSLPLIPYFSFLDCSFMSLPMLFYPPLVPFSQSPLTGQ